jgi:hypothetical protein
MNDITNRTTIHVEIGQVKICGLLPEVQLPILHFDLIDLETGINYGKPKMGWRYDNGTIERFIKEKDYLAKFSKW